jgi:hypothetical protein
MVAGVVQHNIQVDNIVHGHHLIRRNKMDEKKKSAWEEVGPAVIKNFCKKRGISESKMATCSCKDSACDCGLSSEPQYPGFAVGSIGYAAGDMVGSNE